MLRNFIRRGVALEQLESRLNLSAIGFIPHELPELEMMGQIRLMEAADVNGDELVDIVAVTSLGLAWFSNDGGTFSFEETISVSSGVNEIELTDLDGDKDIDVLLAGSHGWEWLSNTDGQGAFARTPGSAFDEHVVHIVAEDFDGDGDNDVAMLGIREDVNEVWWRENSDGKGTFGEPNLIETGLTGTAALGSGDIDLNGLPDLVTIARGSPSEGEPSEVLWYANFDARFSVAIDVFAGGVFDISPQYVRLRDMDSDGDLDLVVANAGLVGWSENLDGEGEFGPAEVIGKALFQTFDTEIVDLDDDGDFDVLTYRSFLSREIIWNENVEAGFEANSTLLETSRVHLALEAADVDNDGDVDVILSPWAWYESDLVDEPLPLIGDINGDGEVSFADFLILSSNYGKSEATRAEGDIDVDGSVGFADFLLLSANYIKR